MLAGEHLSAEDDHFERLDGTVQHLRWEALPWRTAQGDIGGLMIAVEDVTARTQTEDALRANDERLHLALSAGRLATWDLHLPTKKVVWNDEQFRILGYEIGEIAPSYEAWAERLHPEDREATEAIFAQALKEGADYHAEFRSAWPDGTVHWMEGRGSFHRDSQGEVTRGFGVMMDITERKRVERALRENEVRLRLALSGARAAAWQWDVSTGELSWSPECHALYGREPERDLPNYEIWRQCLHPDDLEPTERIIRDIIQQQKQDYRAEYRVVFPTGEERWLASLAKIDYAPDGSPVRMSGINLDITEQKHVEQELQRLNQTLRAYSASGWALVRATDETSFLREICRIVVEDCGHAMVWVGYAEQDAEQSLRPVARRGS